MCGALCQVVGTQHSCRQEELRGAVGRGLSKTKPGQLHRVVGLELGLKGSIWPKEREEEPVRMLVYLRLYGGAYFLHSEGRC